MSKTPKEKEQISKVPYSSVVGSQMYAMICTRPDICYVILLISRFQFNPGIKHYIMVKIIMRYLKGTLVYILCY